MQYFSVTISLLEVASQNLSRYRERVFRKPVEENDGLRFKAVSLYDDEVDRLNQMLINNASWWARSAIKKKLRHISGRYSIKAVLEYSSRQ